jgi:hypothetical protein
MTQLQEKYKYHVSLQIPVYRCSAMCITSPLIMCAFHSTLRGTDATRLTQTLYVRNIQQVNIKFLTDPPKDTHDTNSFNGGSNIRNKSHMNWYKIHGLTWLYQKLWTSNNHRRPTTVLTFLFINNLTTECARNFILVSEVQNGENVSSLLGMSALPEGLSLTAL